MLSEVKWICIQVKLDWLNHKGYKCLHELRTNVYNIRGLDNKINYNQTRVKTLGRTARCVIEANIDTLLLKLQLNPKK